MRDGNLDELCQVPLIVANDAVSGTPIDWREVDARLRAISARRLTLDLEEARWLVLARRARVHERLGFATLLEYIERVLGHAPKTAYDRLRVAESFERLPATRAAFEDGRLSYSAVRELTRVATPLTEDAWVTAATGLGQRDIEAITSGKRPGDLPTDIPHPDAHPRWLRMELSHSTYGLWRDARFSLSTELGHHLTDDELVAELCRAVLVGPPDPGRATHQIAISRCAACERAWQIGGGEPVEISAARLAQAACDCQHLGDVDGLYPERAVQDVSPSTRRAVFARDHGCCVVPGCRSSRYLEIHHIVHRADGGSHLLANLVLLCGAHHRAIHEGTLRTLGATADTLRFTHADGRPYGAPPRPPRPPSSPGPGSAST